MGRVAGPPEPLRGGRRGHAADLSPDRALARARGRPPRLGDRAGGRPRTDRAGDGISRAVADGAPEVVSGGIQVGRLRRYPHPRPLSQGRGEQSEDILCCSPLSPGRGAGAADLAPFLLQPTAPWQRRSTITSGNAPLTIVAPAITIVGEPLTVVAVPLTVVGESLTVVDVPLTVVDVPLTVVAESLTVVAVSLTIVELARERGICCRPAGA